MNIEKVISIMDVLHKINADKSFLADFTLSGSSALKLFGLIDREPADIDIIHSHSIDMEELAHVFRGKGFKYVRIVTCQDDYANNDMYIDGISVQFICKEKVRYTRYKQVIFWMESPLEIIREKWVMAFTSRNSEKH